MKPISIKRKRTQGGGLLSVALGGLGLPFIGMLLIYVGNFLLQLTSWLVTLTGALLNVSITMTLRIKEFLDNTPGVFLVWQTIRDLAGMVVIFLLLYTAFKIILGYDEKVGNMIKNIVIGAILINFSFFIAGAMVDASNIVSLALYRAIAPGSENVASTCLSKAQQNPVGATGLTPTGESYMSCLVSGTRANIDGGLSNMMMAGLQIQNIYKQDNYNFLNTVDSLTDPKKIIAILIGIVAGILIMISTALSFLVASGAFVIRLVILIFLMAFSSIWFAGMMFPDIKASLSDKWWKMFWSQLIFMPVYLLLMYAALRIVTASNLLANVAAQGASAVDGTAGTTGILTILIRYAFIAIALNVPLVAALALGGSATKWIEKAGFDSKTIWKKMGSQLGSRTLGRGANAFVNSERFAKIAKSSPIAGTVLYGGAKKLSGADFGMKGGSYDKRTKDKQELEAKIHEQIGKAPVSRSAMDIRKEKVKITSRLNRDDYDSQQAYDDAIKRELERWNTEEKASRQAEFRNSIPWKPGIITTPLGFMLDNKAKKASQGDLAKKALKERAKSVGDFAAKDIEAMQQTNKSLQQRKEQLEAIPDTQVTSAQEAEYLSIIKKQDDLKLRMDDKQKLVDEANKIRKEEDQSKLLSRLDDVEKAAKSAGGGGGGGGSQPKP